MNSWILLNLMDYHLKLKQNCPHPLTPIFYSPWSLTCTRTTVTPPPPRPIFSLPSSPPPFPQSLYLCGVRSIWRTWDTCSWCVPLHSLSVAVAVLPCWYPLSGIYQVSTVSTPLPLSPVSTYTSSPSLLPCTFKPASYKPLISFYLLFYLVFVLYML